MMALGGVMHMMSLCSFSHCNGDCRWHNAYDVTVSAIVMVTVGGVMHMMSLFQPLW